MSKHSSQALGQAGEDAALQHLLAAGLKLVTRNYRCRWGEIDLVFEDKDCLVFVEVRLRKHQRYGGAEASVDARKQIKLRKTALHFMQTYNKSSRQSARIDVVAVQPGPEQYTCNWILNAVEG